LARTPEIGHAPPDFTLPGVQLTAGEFAKADYTLSAQRGNPVVLAFYPGDNTSVCTRQLCSYTSGLDSFTGFGATVWAISPQGLDSHEKFARAYGITLGGAGLRRSVFVIDADGILRWKHVTLVGLTFPSAETISAQLAALGST
jgi:thioredoxin-dependent peroxiredoxin